MAAVGPAVSEPGEARSAEWHRRGGFRNAIQLDTGQVMTARMVDIEKRN
jgi:hypothetical protein